MFVANPDVAPPSENIIFARPDDLSDTGETWRTVLCRYNETPGDNRYGLLPAWRLYRNRTYRMLAEYFGLDRLYILSAGWGVIPADFLTPNYDITLRAVRHDERYKRRRLREKYSDFAMLPAHASAPVLFFGGKGYIRLFCELTADTASQRTVFFAGREPTAPGCRLKRFGNPFTNWPYQCANAWVKGAIRHD